MPVWKYRSIEEMPDAGEMNRDVPVGQRLRALMSMGRFVEPLDIPRGVTKFHSIEELQADRDRYERQRIERIRARNAAK